MRLCHYTSPAHLPLIETDGFIKTSESNVSLTEDHFGPDVVWLTTDFRWPDIPTGAGPLHIIRHGLSVAKALVRITVEIPNGQFHRWDRWSMKHRMLDAHRKVFVAVAGGGAHSWYVVERPIPQSEWVSVDVRDHPLVEVLSNAQIIDNDR